MTIPNIGFARSGLEVDLWMQLHPCPNCGELDIGEPKTDWGVIVTATGKHNGGFYHLTCPRCAHQRSIAFYELAEFREHVDWGHLGGSRPSQIIAPHEFATELDTSLASLLSEFSTLTEAELGEQGQLCKRAIISVNELAKFIPSGTDEVPDSALTDADAIAYKRNHPGTMTRAYLTATKARLEELATKIRARAEQLEQENPPTGKRRLPVSAFSLASLKLHEQWVQHGDVGDNQQLIATGADARETNLSGRTLAEMVLDKVTLDRADLSSAVLDGSKLTDVYIRDANLSHAQLRHCTMLRVQFAGSDMTSCKLVGGSLADCDLARTRAPSSFWFHATVERCSFRGADLTDAMLSKATFFDCDFRDADLSFLGQGVNTADGARFIGCDLRGTKWGGRNLSGTLFVNCKMSGLRGRPLTAGVIVEGPDLSSSGDGSNIGTADDITKAWNSAD